MSEFSLSPSKLSPAARASLIMVAFFFGLLGLTSFWLLSEARRITREKVLTREANVRFESDMIWVSAGRFTMGGIGEDAPPDELPLHDIKIGGFWMDKCEVSNEQWAKFAKAMSYVTVAERRLAKQETEAGATWQHPAGPASNLAGKERHPVVQVCYDDAIAYCKWAAKRLPTEAEWEYAARGGFVAQPFVWGQETRPGGKWMANLRQDRPSAEAADPDGFDRTAPVGSFPANNFGLHDMAGNVWELTDDWYRPDAYALLAKHGEREARRNPRGPADSFDPDEPNVWKKVARGGSWLSVASSREYRPSVRWKVAPTFARQDLGFRCVKDGAQP